MHVYCTVCAIVQTILLGHDDGYARDRAMTVTVMLNYFGKNLVQRMPQASPQYHSIQLAACLLPLGSR